ncbi:hypothetical protein QJS10_CPB18g00535 [Acorus calamus]|uniref:Reverse transcriptase zinc-binding domain-containing protein n=1 Tax=Acorus calamus TaxID=4465 RepID=A0AAV9CKM7_ACOCL|nr:hypothetical protein QJS10_CPB18g00535 [Acorus calamus]
MCETTDETTDHLFVHCPVVCSLWHLLKRAMDFNPQFHSLHGLWEAGQKLKASGDMSSRAKVS